jgi:hypothetical protein
MADLKTLTNSMFYKKSDWVNITDEEKESCFFIINRMFSKKYPEKSQLFNNKNIDKVSSMNLWFSFMLDKSYPKWFWSKSPSVEKANISEKDFNLLLTKLKIKDLDLIYLIDKHYEFIEDELKYFKELEKQNKK